MNDLSNLSHTAWDCKYHIVWIPKYRKKVLYGQLRKHLGQVLRELAIRKESLVVEGHLMADHVHMLIVIPPKYAVSQVVGFIKGKSAIHSPGHTPAGSRTSPGSISGPEDITCPRRGGIKKPSGNISAGRKKKTKGWTS